MTTNEFNFDDMLAQVKENMAKVEAENQTETQLAFSSHRAASDIFYRIANELEGWTIKACESRPVPAHYQNTCVLVREEKADTDEETQPSDA